MSSPVIQDSFDTHYGAPTRDGVADEPGNIGCADCLDGGIANVDVGAVAAGGWANRLSEAQCTIRKTRVFTGLASSRRSATNERLDPTGPPF